MKRKLLALATALALALSLSVCVSAAGQQAGSWTKLSEASAAPAGSDLALARQLNQLGLFRGPGRTPTGP